MKRIIFGILLLASISACGEKIGDKTPAKTTPDYWASHALTVLVSATEEVEDFASFYLIGQSDENAIFAADGVLDCDVVNGGIRFVDSSMSTAPITPKKNGIVTLQLCQDDFGVVNNRLVFINGNPITATTDKAGNSVYNVKLCDPSDECPGGIIWYNPEVTAEDQFVVELTTTSNELLGVLSSYTVKATDPSQLLSGLEYLSSWQPITHTVQGAGYLSVHVYDATGNTSKIVDCTMSATSKVYATVKGKTSLLGQCNENALFLRIDATGDSWPVGIPVIFKTDPKNTSKPNPSTDSTTNGPATNSTVNPGNGSLNLAPNQLAINFTTVGANGVSVVELHCWNYTNPTTPHDPIFGNWENILTEGQNYVYTNSTAIQCNGKLSNGQWYVEKSGIKLSLAKIKVSLPDAGVSFWLDNSQLWIDNGVNGGNIAFQTECSDTNNSGSYDSCSLLTKDGVVIQ